MTVVASPTTHPAPERAHIHNGALWFGLFAGPAAWSVQTLVNTTVAAHACYPRIEPVGAPVTSGLRLIVLVVSVVAMLVCVAAIVVAYRAWARTSAERQESTGGGRAHGRHVALLETGEGRTRFMALAGVIMSSTFLLVTAVHAATLLFVLPCWG